MDEKSAYPRYPKVSLGQAIAIGLGAGAVGATIMTLSNKLEQAVTYRPNSYVPGHTTGALLNIPRDRHPDVLNQVHHYGMGIVTGPIRALMAYYGVIGPFASFLFTGLRIAADQVVENAAGTSALPWTWPINEQVIDLLHKGVFALMTGYICDRAVRGVDWFNR
ncbi:hypothetical protein EPUS_05786 [Endocarpon pusillum Z07020]|uniref:DUF1440 domain-containing protein n=1 Tax=Endocarpon pusillum (strain Z07020 / HMAS-L-300199) TaxID=1263415 RepID=U1GHQ8_ENDPU|nr:uncharacterized protein EPUS_05786 [Endocarpon pusillum Z07020]ERF77217.1 hypothetical protein EPUS_05786 [Endocarpon pusillum Z07020]